MQCLKSIAELPVIAGGCRSVVPKSCGPILTGQGETSLPDIMPRKGNSTTGRIAVAAIGIGFVIHSHAMQAATCR
jgi:hypothetical protein